MVFLEFLQHPFKFTNFVDELWSCRAATGGCLNPEFLQSFGQLLFSHGIGGFKLSH